MSRQSKYFKPFIKKCECGVSIAILRTSNGKTIAVQIDSLTEQEKIDIRCGVNFFYATDHHICHWLTCSIYKDQQKQKFDATIDNRYNKD